MVSGQQVTTVEKIAKMNETLIGNGFHPVQRRASARVVEYNPGMVYVALFRSVLRLSMPFVRKHASALGR